MSRHITLDTPTLPDPHRVEWMAANGINAEDVPAAQAVLVEESTLTFVEYVRDEAGNKVLGDDGYEKRLRTVPLISAPENHGL